MDDLHRHVFAESEYGTQIAPSPITFETDAFKVKNYICSKIYMCQCRSHHRKYTLDTELESEEA